MAILQNKIDFAAIVSVTRANINGDPLNGNRPREDYDGYGIFSDVAIKRKIRNRLQDMVAKAVTKMKKDRVPTINGNDGTAYFMVYEGDGSGTGRETSSGWQNNRKTADYVGEIAQYFNASRLKPVKTTGLGREAFFDHMADHSGAKCVEEQD